MTAGAPSRALAAQRPALRPDVMLSGPLLDGSATVHLVEVGRSGRSFLMGDKEYFLLARLDGERTLGELGEEYARHFGRRLGDANWAQLLRLLWTKGLLAGAPDAAVEPEPSRRGVLAGTFELVPDATALTDRLLRVAGFALRPWFLLPVLLLAAAMEAQVAAGLGGYLRQSRPLLHQPASLVAVGCALWLSSAFHELAHGVAGRRFGARVSGMGLRWRLPVVIAYCSVDGLPYLRSRWQQAAVSVAGTVANLFFLLPFWALHAVLPHGASARSAVAGLLLAGSALALVNLVPLPPFDGYKIVGQVLRVHRLASGSGRYLALRAARLLGRRTGAPGGTYSGRARTVYTAYGIGAVLLLCGATAAVTAVCDRALAPHLGAWVDVLPGGLAVVLPVLNALGGRWRGRGPTARTAPESPSTKRFEGT
ncbi:site-2 protease family protein [Streptomyces sp. NPDC007264]|uniref:site-2 protease family protein n=1 Tax=Streptomyces sp. NPDC007264 TaxID=3364777 RepID=UPI0036DABE51